MTTITVDGHDFNINITKEFCTKGAEMALKLQSEFGRMEQALELDIDTLADTAQDIGNSCLEMLFWAFGEDNVRNALGREIDINKLVNFTAEACQKISEKLPKDNKLDFKIKI